MDDLILTDKFERFEQARFDRRQRKDSLTFSEYLSNGTYVILESSEEGKYYEATPKDSYYKLVKAYYPSGRIRAKGWAYIDYFQKGVWYGFDDGGNLIANDNYDKPFPFTFEDVLKFCQRNNIKVERGHSEAGAAWTTRILRGGAEGDECWSIEHMRFDGKGIIETIYLNGKTGKEIRRDSMQYRPG